MLKYFKKEVLAVYRNDIVKYRFTENEEGGEIQFENFSLSYGFSKTEDGEIIVTTFIYLLSKLDYPSKRMWDSFEITSPNLVKYPPFENWKLRNEKGEWTDESDTDISSLITNINEVFRYSLGVAFFRKENHVKLLPPRSENSLALDESLSELNTFLSDNITKESLEKLAEKLGIKLSDASKSLNSLKEILPEDIQSFRGVLKSLSKSRNNNCHTACSDFGEAIDATNIYFQKLKAVKIELNNFLRWVEFILSCTVEDAQIGISVIEEEKKLIEETSNPDWQTRRKLLLSKCNGKTIKGIELGVEDRTDDAKIERMHIYFTDGSILFLDLSSYDTITEEGIQRPQNIDIDGILYDNVIGKKLSSGDFY